MEVLEDRCKLVLRWWIRDIREHFERATGGLDMLLLETMWVKAVLLWG